MYICMYMFIHNIYVIYIYIYFYECICIYYPSWQWVWGPFFFLLVVCIDLNHPRTAKSSHDFTLCSYSPQAQNQQKRFIRHCVQERQAFCFLLLNYLMTWELNATFAHSKNNPRAPVAWSPLWLYTLQGITSTLKETVTKYQVLVW